MALVTLVRFAVNSCRTRLPDYQHLQWSTREGSRGVTNGWPVKETYLGCNSFYRAPAVTAAHRIDSTTKAIHTREPTCESVKLHHCGAFNEFVISRNNRSVGHAKTRFVLNYSNKFAHFIIKPKVFFQRSNASLYLFYG